MQELTTQNVKWILGIDVSKKKFDIALLSPAGKRKSKVFGNNASGFSKLDAWLAKLGVEQLHACMEATGVYWEALGEHLADAGHRVSVINPARIKAFGVCEGIRTKTDKADARLIATYCARNTPQLWQAPPQTQRALRALVLRRLALDKMRTQECNRLQVAHPAVRQSVQALIAELEEKMAEIEQSMRDLINQDAHLREQFELLDSVPGLGEKTIAVLLSYFSQYHRFGKANKASAYVGLNVALRQSGSSVKLTSRLSKVWPQCRKTRPVHASAGGDE